VSYEHLAEALIHTGNISRARQVADEFVRRYPDNAAGQRMLGMVLVAEGRLDEARAALDKSQALNPLDFVAKVGARNVAHLQGRLADVEAAVEELSRSSSAFQRMLSLIGAQSLATLRGQGERMVELAERSVALPGLGPQQRAQAMNRSARTLLRLGRFEAALARAEAARREAQGQDAECESLQLLAQTQAASGRTADAERTVAELEARAKALAPERELRRVHWARGAIALRRGDAATAAAEHARAAAMLPVHGPPLGPPSSHGDLWFEAAQALINAGREGDAARLLERLQSGYERAFALDAYVRSLYLLAQIEERRGNDARARDLYTRFLDWWGDGDVERGWVENARSRLARGG
jgi:tetratricopeptide (TPR) repeat protein